MTTAQAALVATVAKHGRSVHNGSAWRTLRSLEASGTIEVEWDRDVMRGDLPGPAIHIARRGPNFPGAS